MTYQRIKYFLQTVESGSITKAAELLYLSTPALSKQLSKLEEELGGKLIERTAKGIRLTEFGEFAAKKLTELDAFYQKTLQEIHEHIVPQRPLLRVGFFSALPQDQLISPVISFLFTNFSSYRFDFELLEIDEDKEMFLSGELDLLFTDIMEGQTFHHSRAYVFERSEPKIVVSKNHPWAQKKSVTKEEMASMTLLKPQSNRISPIYSKPDDFFDHIPCSNILPAVNQATLTELLRLGNSFIVVPEKTFPDEHFVKLDYPDRDIFFYTVLLQKTNSSLPGLDRIVRSLTEQFHLKNFGIL